MRTQKKQVPVPNSRMGFDVNMPECGGEPEKKAFLRLKGGEYGVLHKKK